jgi:hypothetical protein
MANPPHIHTRLKASGLQKALIALAEWFKQTKFVIENQKNKFFCLNKGKTKSKAAIPSVI